LYVKKALTELACEFKATAKDLEQPRTWNSQGPGTAKDLEQRNER
jgi:hypothetical protein